MLAVAVCSSSPPSDSEVLRADSMPQRLAAQLRARRGRCCVTCRGCAATRRDRKSQTNWVELVAAQTTTRPWLRRPSTSIAESFSLSCVNASASRPSRSRTSSGARQALVTPACRVGAVEELSSRSVLHWLERDLGPYRGRGVAKPEWDAEFSVLQFDDRPV